MEIANLNYHNLQILAFLVFFGNKYKDERIAMNSHKYSTGSFFYQMDDTGFWIERYIQCIIYENEANWYVIKPLMINILKWSFWVQNTGLIVYNKSSKLKM